MVVSTPNRQFGDGPGEAPLPPHPLTRRRGGAGKYIALLAVVAVAIAGWTGLWFYAKQLTEDTITGWQAREARAGRVHICHQQSTGGFPFRIEVTCDQAESQIRNLTPPLRITVAGLHVAAQIYQRELLIAEMAGPMTIADIGRPAVLRADWTLAQASLRGTPAAPERLSVVFEEPKLDDISGPVPVLAAQAKHMELHGRIIEGTVSSNPVVELVSSVTGGSFPVVHALAQTPIDSEMTAKLRGLKDFAPKPWAARFREIQQAGGSIDISQARISQGETLAVGSGVLTINANGKLEGQLRLTIAGLDAFLKTIGIENTPPVDKIAGALDRLMPGLGAAARAQAGAGVMAGINMIGEQTTLEGRRAVAVPLRITDGAMALGPLVIGRVPALF